MIAQWENKIMSSMLQFVDHEVCSKGQAFMNHVGTFYPINSKYSSYHAYALPFKQVVGDSSITNATVMQGVSVDGNYAGFDCTNSPCVGDNDLRGILHHKGQVIFAADKSSNTITGNLSIKEYNIYITTKLEEELLFNTKYQANPKINQSLAGLTNEEETFPAIFLKNMGGTNDPLCFGGIDNVKTRVRAVILSDSAYSLDALCNILKNTARKNLPIIENLPFNSIGAFTGVIYNYQDLSSSSTEQGAIWDVTVTKLMPDAKELQGLDLKVFAALVDFEIHGFGKNIT
jgi:hypothetical protein